MPASGDNLALAEVSKPMDSRVALYAIATGQGCAEVSSFDPTTDRGASMLVQATLMECKKLNTMAGMELAIVDFYGHDTGRVADDGELDEWVRIVLFDADGNAYQCGSRGVAKSLGVFARVRPDFPWNPPIKAKVNIETLPGPKLWITLRPDVSTLILPK